MEPCNEGSDSKQVEVSVDSLIDDEVKSITFTTTLIQCYVCNKPLSPPISQCGYGHVVCHRCGPKLKYKCCNDEFFKCLMRLHGCRGFDNLLQSMRIACPNGKHGCKKIMNYDGFRNHKCIYEPCSCPLSNCNFVATSKMLSDHFIQEHRDSRIQFSYDISFVVSLKSNDKLIVLQEKNDGNLFILNNRTVDVGKNAVNINCVGPITFGYGYRYAIMASSKTFNMQMQSYTESIQCDTSEPLSGEFTVISFGHFGSTKPFKLKICINSKSNSIMEPCTEGSDCEQDEDSVDVVNNVVYKSITFTISDPSLLHCCDCFKPLSSPVFQCSFGHVVCFKCRYKPGHDRDCSMPLIICRVFDKLLQSMEISCPNEKHGCMKKLSYYRFKTHKCIYLPCHCPLSGCNFVASSKNLSDHFIQKHRDSRIQFSYDNSFIVSFKSNNEPIILQEKNDGKLFILNNRNVRKGNAVNISRIGPKTFGHGYHYDIMARSETLNMKLQSYTESVQCDTTEPLSAEFFVIPFDHLGSAEHFKLEVCINSKMRIFIREHSGARFPLEVESLDTFENVKEQIQDKKEIPINDHRLFFNGRQGDHQTLADCNIQNESTIHLEHIFRGGGGAK